MIMNDDLVMISTTLKVAEKAKVIYEETPNYTKEELFADIGGALGLFLGLGSPYWSYPQGFPKQEFSRKTLKKDLTYWMFSFSLGLLCDFQDKKFSRAWIMFSVVNYLGPTDYADKRPNAMWKAGIIVKP